MPEVVSEHESFRTPSGTVRPSIQPVLREGVPVMRIDLHCHSEASHDCKTPLKLMPGACLTSNIRVLAVTDHDQVWGGLELQKIVREEGLEDDFWVIPGEEVTTSEGELNALFLKERIPPNLTPEETVKEIRAQGGLVMLQHGFDPLKRHRLRPEATMRIADSIDIVETFNARLSRRRWNAAAVVWANERNLPQAAGSDAHTIQDIGEAWTETPLRPVKTPEDLIAALRAGTVGGVWTHPVEAYLKKQWRQIKNKYGW